MASLETLLGSVADFDDDRGLGTVRGADGVDYPFHCTQIADGSRTIESGAEVRFTVIAGKSGRWEAGEITPV